MLDFSRNKLIGVYQTDADTLQAHGVLDDDIYSLEVDVTVRISDRTIIAARGRWLRDTTPDCHRAVPVVKEAVGIAIDDQTAPWMHKNIGRRGCRHFANLLIECCDSVTEAMAVIGWKAAVKTAPDLTYRQYLAGDSSDPAPATVSEPEKALAQGPTAAASVNPSAGNDHRLQTPKSDGFIMDLHVHTAPASPCSSAPVDGLIERAKSIGLNGICLTDHNYVWPPHHVADLRQKHQFLILRGNEITTDQGDILVFGLEEDIRGIIKLENLRETAVAAGAFMIAAHPFRGFLVFGAGELGLTPEKAMERRLFRYVDAVEVLNGKVTARENGFAAQVARNLGMPRTGGSDAHDIDEVGQYATRFPAPIGSEAELIEALKAGQCAPVHFLKEN